MRFHRPNTPRSQVAVIPLIDILFVLLIFFIVSTAFKKKRDVLRIQLPTVNEIPTDSVRDSRSTIAVDAAGNVSLDALAVPDGLLQNYLKVFQQQNPGRKLELKADRNLPIEKLLKTWDSLTKAGISIQDVPARINLPDKPKP
jgi:biopolymer transport protein ExbD